jgi:elongation factor P--(R)-beta-lysine ligase
MTDSSDSHWFSRSRHADRRGYLLARNRIIVAVRRWFEERDFIEIDAPALVVSPGNEAHLHAFQTTLVDAEGQSSSRYLHTSPEFACKKLLAAGEQRIYALAHVFRNRESTPTHAPEFTMLEWYRAKAIYTDVIDDTIELIRLAATVAEKAAFSWRDRMCDPYANVEFMTCQQAFHSFAGIDLFETLDRNGLPDRDALARISPVAFATGESWSDIFSRILVEKVEPCLGVGNLTVLFEYPSCEAALARKSSRDPRIAERFEIYACGVELCNGFGELTDSKEQRMRFVAEMDLKQERYGERYPLDEDLLQALTLMPEASGVALGLDRVIMLATGAKGVRQIMWVPS